jgi:polysaccharide biosynthesis transport protein
VVGMIPLVRRGGLRRTHAADLLTRAVAEPLSGLSEAVRAARVALLLSGAGKRPKVILVTSAIPYEGKSTTATLLAASTSMSGQRSLLIDCDLRRQSASRSLGRRGKPGLIEVLAGSATRAEAVQHDPASGLDLIAVGSGSVNPGDLLDSQRMRDLLAALRQDYDFIVLDSSPLLPVVDATILATMVDKIAMVVQWSRTPRASVVEALSRLDTEMRRTASVVINQVDIKRLRGYGYGYGYGYNYGKYYGVLSKYHQGS